MSRLGTTKLPGLIFILLGLCSCTSLYAPLSAPPPTPQRAPQQASPPPSPQAQSSLASRLRLRQAKAEALMKQDYLAAALINWEILQALDPDNSEFRQRTRAITALIQQKVQEHLRSGKQAFKREHFRQARQEFLTVLALDPLQAEPLMYLKRMEQRHLMQRQRAKLAQLSKAVRETARQQPCNNRQPEQYAQAAEHSHLKTAVEHFRQRDFAMSIRLLQTYLTTHPESHKAKQYLAESHFQLGQSFYRQGNMAAALSHFKAARKTSPNKEPQINLYIRQISTTLTDHQALQLLD